MFPPVYGSVKVSHKMQKDIDYLKKEKCWACSTPNATIITVCAVSGVAIGAFSSGPGGAMIGGVVGIGVGAALVAIKECKQKK